MKCKSCGAKIPEQSSFCGMCGYDLRGIIDGDFIENQQFTQKIEIYKKTKVSNKLRKKFLENINSTKIQLSKKTNEVHRLMKKATKNIHSKVLVITDGWTWVTEGNYTYVRGSVKNIGNRTINHFEVNVKYEDVNKNVLDSDFTNWNRKVQPGESKEFEIKHHVNKNYQCIDISVNNYKYFL